MDVPHSDAFVLAEQGMSVLGAFEPILQAEAQAVEALHTAAPEQKTRADRDAKNEDVDMLDNVEALHGDEGTHPEGQGWRVTTIAPEAAAPSSGAVLLVSACASPSACLCKTLEEEGLLFKAFLEEKALKISWPLIFQYSM
jgi:hypothetical protein